MFLKDIGAGKGKYYAVNFPLRDGIDDESYEQGIFQPVSNDNYDNRHFKINFFHWCHENFHKTVSFPSIVFKFFFFSF